MGGDLYHLWYEHGRNRCKPHSFILDFIYDLHIVLKMDSLCITIDITDDIW
jgi:hypothetical protein